MSKVNRPLLLLLLFIVCHTTSSRRWGNSYWMENLDDAYFDMSKSMGNGVTQVEWQLDRTTSPSPAAPPSGKCTLKFLSERDNLRGTNVAIFSTGETGYWRVKGSSGGAPILNASYDKALSSTARYIEIEVPSKKNRSVLVYELPMGTGSVQPMAVVGRGTGRVRYYEKGPLSLIHI